MVLAHEDQERSMKQLRKPQNRSATYGKLLYKKGNITKTQGKEVFLKLGLIETSCLKST